MRSVVKPLSWLLAALTAASGAEITVDTARVLQESFGGLGYEVEPVWWREGNRSRGFTRQQIEGVLARRWSEQRPGVAVVPVRLAWWAPDAGREAWESDAMVSLRRFLDMCKRSRTDVCLALDWSGGFPTWMPSGLGGKEAPQAAAAIAAGLEHLLRQHGYSNVRHLDLARGLAGPQGPIPPADVEQLAKLLQPELEKENLASALDLATPVLTVEDVDAPLPGGREPGPFGTLGARVFTEGSGEELGGLYERLAGVASGRGLPLWIAPLGGWNGAAPTEPPEDFGDAGYGLRLARHALCAMRAGVSALAVRRWADIDSADWPLTPFGGGLCGGSAENFAPREGYGAWALLVRHFGRGCRLYGTTSDDPGVLALAGRQRAQGPVVLAILNDGAREEEISVNFTGSEQPGDFLRSHVYPPAEDAAVAVDDLAPVAQATESRAGEFTVTVPAHHLAVVTDELGEKPEQPVEDFTATRLGPVVWLSWARHPSRDLAAYQLTAGGEPLAQTVGLRWFAELDASTDEFGISPVPFSGAAGDPTEVTARPNDWKLRRDTAEDFSRLEQHNEGVIVTTDLPGRRNGDPRAYARSKPGVGRLVYEADRLAFVRVVVHLPKKNENRLGFYASDDGEGPWERLEPLLAGRSDTADDWQRLVFVVPDIPSGTSFFKLEFDDKTAPGQPQIGEVDLWTEE